MCDCNRAHRGFSYTRRRVLINVFAGVDEMKLYKSLKADIKSVYDDSQWEIGKWRKTECVELCHGFNASRNIIDAMSFVNMENLALVETKGKTFKSDDKITSESMRIVRAWKWEKKDSVALAIYAAELVIDIFEKVYPDDKRPRNAIEAAKNYLKNPTPAARAAAGAAWAAWAVARAAGAAGAAEAAAWAAWAVARDAGAAEAAGIIKKQCHDWIINHIPELEEIK